MAEEVGAAAVKVLVQNVIDLSKNEISLIRGLKKEAQKLTLNLHTTHQFLNDAEKRINPSGDVKTLRKRLENAGFEADNVLDELYYHALSKTINKKFKVLTCFSPFIHVASKRKMAVSIKKINEDLKSINKGLQEKLAYAPTAPDADIETDSYSADPIFIGRDEIVSEIVETLITSVTTQRDFSILPIVGMGGLGKTTLTRRVFHHQMIKNQFGSRIWVHVSQVFDPINLFNKILEELTQSQSNNGVSRQKLLTELQKALEDKTYLLVLDDVWNQDHSKWNDFLDSLSGVTTTRGNGIIVTTRNTMVASTVRKLPIHHLNFLSLEDCWSIIREKTFRNEVIPSDFESVGREIAERCCGLPLAASVVGGVLRDKSADKWRSIRHNWLSKGEVDNHITKVLRLSFNNLSSPSLKKCFAYCSIFPRGEQIVKEKLIELWMAEGFLGRDDMESEGDMFYDVLLHSSLLQVAKREEYEEYERCVMHDLVHDLASSVLGSSNNADGVSQVRYLIQEGESSPITKEVAEHLRTLIFRVDQLSDDTIFSGLKCLRVLTLTDIYLEELPISIRKLIHLRYLNISKTRIRHLPQWIGELYYLQTLRAECTGQLPSGIKCLINLRNLHVGNVVELPAEIGRLTSLQALWADFMVRDTNGYKIEELGSLNNLKGSLKIRALEKVRNKQEAKKANLSKKSKLSELQLEWTSNREEVERNHDEDVLEGLQPHSNLKKLQIKGFKGKRLPEWASKMPSKLTSLTDLVLEELNGLESLPDELFHNNPNLSVLHIRRCPKLREIPDGLQTLNSLTIAGVPKFMATSVEVWQFPKLRELEIDVSMEGSRETSVATKETVDRILQGCSCNSLRKLSLTGMEIWECLPESIQHLTLLENLELNNFGMKELPEWFDHYISHVKSSCFYLKLSECKRLRRLPSTDAMRRLIEAKRVTITGRLESTTM